MLNSCHVARPIFAFESTLLQRCVPQKVGSFYLEALPTRFVWAWKCFTLQRGSGKFCPGRLSAFVPKAAKFADLPTAICTTYAYTDMIDVRGKSVSFVAALLKIGLRMHGSAEILEVKRCPASDPAAKTNTWIDFFGFPRRCVRPIVSGVICCDFDVFLADCPNRRQER